MPNFIDTARITVKSGAGGNGVVSFHREKYVAAGGPDGGDGGRGGDVIIRVDRHMSTLMDFRYKRKYVAENGADGQGKRCSGRDGQPLVIKVPLGTVVRDAETREIICDMSGDEPFVLCRGGNGGWGNKHFATPTRQVPRFAKAGLPGQERSVLLELKLLADVGLVGFPNVGKSTLLSVVSKAQPKIANYHFTTLYPNLGVVYVEEGVSFVLADIPGIIEGASEGAGLGHDFLRHVDRCRLLIHVVDVSGSEGRDPVADFEAINEELKQYSPELASRPMLVAGNKVDIAEDRTLVETLKAHVEAKGMPFFELSAAAHLGTRELMLAAAGKLRELPPVTVYEPTYVQRPPQVDTSEPLTITHEDDVWIVEGPWLQKTMANVNFGDYESRNWFDRMLRESGLFDRLEEMGIQDGDTVSLYNLEFEYQK
ncbi:GTPase ObgE [Pseudoflavonifractor sp. BIOML-A6]|nr:MULTISPECIES: GTPase ObgE [unclassified Pseudoflavonifractor]MTQ98388.1 GTPase ObgE [Pseudoflavonifractor sp. BIOML-A16]MTR06085.1 GTPase ObgE [Pseudoflavonifractor sp. BIOML-A15]MTR33778.1 GTPase ObgE [Pseudoflavonifractor sp. BIOML-A14]MTR74634.1 GTPase ObgE [Pseudoflavonifractor sp. BIOML-A18]MTS63322.1 GTPase ObgE [Pseudoflavonifractor sp. BIOML-A5]MTS70869.1 GTPase ObgE [Pseudoflavonifractor sp. BIOML-A8]MTS90290.1 GTPase ObgE [Pseudoflavonifractor sp. BIOML-A4]